MKKKQLQKLKQQFRPSFENAQRLLFRSLEEQSKRLHQLDIKVYLNPKKLDELRIERLDDINKEQVVAVPLDDNFNTIIKRIQQQERGVLESFSINLANEVANYWHRAANEEKQSPAQEEALPVLDDKPNSTTQNKGYTKANFIEEILKFPKFAVQEKNNQLLITEKSANEERLLATISMTQVHEFTIEPALARKYKLKLEVIPVIECFAATPLQSR